jgi:uncharacterized protein YjbI with pentapeptide repeats
VVDGELLSLLQVNSKSIEECEFTSVNFPELAGLYFFNCVFISCTAKDILISGCVFEGCDFNNMNFSGSEIFRTDFINCFIEDSQFITSKFSEVSFSDCDVIGNSFARGLLQSVEFEEVYFSSNGLVDLKILNILGLNIYNVESKSGHKMVYDSTNDMVYHNLIAGTRAEVIAALRRESRIMPDEVRMEMKEFLENLLRRER